MVSIPKYVLAVGMSLSFVFGAARSEQSTSRFYCCEGGKICADSMPEQCRGKAYRILDSKGNVLQEVARPLTPEQRAEQALEERRRREIDERLREQRRKDQALLVTYATLEDIDLAEKKAEADVNFAIKETEARIDVARQKRKKFESEAEFYRNRPLPPEVAKGLHEATHQIQVQEELLAVKRADLLSIKGKYSSDRKRYIELTGARPPASR